MFYRDLKPIKRAASFLNIPGKACVKRVHNNDALIL